MVLALANKMMFASITAVVLMNSSAFPLRQPQIFAIIRRAEQDPQSLWNNDESRSCKIERSHWLLKNEGRPLIGSWLLSSKDAVGCCHGAEMFYQSVCLISRQNSVCVCLSFCVKDRHLVSVSTVGLNLLSV